MKPAVVRMMGLSSFETTSLEQKYLVVPQEDPRSHEAQALITYGTLGPTRDQLAKFPQLKLICVLGVGYEKVDVKAAAEKGIRVTNGSGTNSNAVADHTMGLLISVAREIPFKDREIRSGTWKQASRPQLAGMKLGLFGLGDIGEKIAKRAAAFDMEISYFNRHKRDDIAYEYVSTLKALAEKVDYLIVTVPGSDETNHAVNSEILKALGPKGFLIHISRGSVVDTTALIEALKAKHIAGAALDVLESEPTVPPDLLKFENVVLTPHMAGVSPESTRAMIERCEANLDALFSGQPLTAEVKP